MVFKHRLEYRPRGSNTEHYIRKLNEDLILVRFLFYVAILLMKRFVLSLAMLEYGPGGLNISSSAFES